MRYYIDTEFSEKTKRPLFGKPYHFLQLISIGIVAEDGREYYAINQDFTFDEASDWVKHNVLKPLVDEYVQLYHGDIRNIVLGRLEGKSLKKQIAIVQKNIGKPLTRIREEIIEFMGGCYDETNGNKAFVPTGTKILAYYADYDWVAFCSIFGSMIDLPQGMPMYCRDLKQILDSKRLTPQWKNKNCPDPVGEHNALVDARWNMNLYNKIFNL